MRYSHSLRPTSRGTDAWKGSKFVKGIVVTLTLLVPGTALAQEEGSAAVACTVSGYDVIIHNRGTDPIASGASVDWSVPFARMQGNHTLTSDLEPDDSLFLSGVLGSNYLDSSAECTASLGTEPLPPQ